MEFRTVNQAFGEEGNLGRRRQRIPSKECHICGKVLRDKYNLKRHISSHLGK